LLNGLLILIYLFFPFNPEESTGKIKKLLQYEVLRGNRKAHYILEIPPTFTSRQSMSIYTH